MTSVRPARPDEFALLGPIECEATERFVEIGLPVAVVIPTAQRGEIPLAAFVVGQPPVGFLWMTQVGDLAHLEEVAVLRSHGRQGIGRSLLEAGCGWAEAAGYDAVTLCTFRDVPWNGPFYRSAGFVEFEMAEWSPELASIRASEQANGLDDIATRVVMIRRFGRPRTSGSMR